MTVRRIVLGLTGLACIAAIGGAGWMVFSPPPGRALARFEDLRSAGRFEAAADVLREYIDRVPKDDRARLLLAQLMLERPDQAPATDPDVEVDRVSEALEQIERIDAGRLSAADQPLLELLRGKALFALGDWDGSEDALMRALKLDPLVPEASWGLLNQYYLEGRGLEAQELALRMHGIEPDRRDRVQFLLELIRQDAQPPDPSSMVQVLEPIVAAKPEQVRPTLTLGFALVRAGRVDEGLELLRRFVESHPGSAEGWDILLQAIDAAGRPEVFLQAVEQLPATLRETDRFARHHARAAQEQADWPAAVAAYRRAVAYDPLDSSLLYRLSQALAKAGDDDEARRLSDRVAAYKTGMEEVRAVYREANALPTLGYRPDPALYRRLGELRDRMLRPAEGRAWYALAIEADPGDAESAAALERLGGAVRP